MRVALRDMHMRIQIQRKIQLQLNPREWPLMSGAPAQVPPCAGDIEWAEAAVRAGTGLRGPAAQPPKRAIERHAEETRIRACTGLANRRAIRLQFTGVG